jgi:hypothetical protein
MWFVLQMEVWRLPVCVQQQKSEVIRWQMKVKEEAELTAVPIK